jgi:signal transduction histidine kinase/DNA-binding response OmpR family regulator
VSTAAASTRLAFLESYLNGLRTYHVLGSERGPDVAQGLDLAQELGRQALGDELGVLDVVSAHVEAVAALAGDVACADLTDRSALPFLLATLAPLDMAGRGFLESRSSYRRQLARAEALVELDIAKTTFFQNISHELRTPLTLVLGPLDDLLADPSMVLPPEHQAGLTEAHRAGQRLRRMVDALLEVGRAEAGRLQPARAAVDLSGLTIDCASMFRSAAEQAGLTLSVDAPPSGQRVLVDPGMWATIVFNLVSNAVKYTRKGSISVLLERTDGDARLTVADTGVGIARSELSTVFNRFHRTGSADEDRIEGTGIGLSLVRDLARTHGGDVAADSRLGAGTTMTVTIPVTVAAPDVPTDDSIVDALTSDGVAAYLPAELTISPHPEAEPMLAADSAEGEILVVEDNADLAAYLSRMLRRDGWAVTIAADEESAIQHAVGARPDLILSDVMLPGRSGLDLLATVRAADELHRVPVVMLTARADGAADALTQGADDYIVKPFESNELLARIRTQVELARLREYALSQAEERSANLKVALATNRQIGAAIGILMVTERITSEQAFDRLRDVSQRTHRKLRDVADEVVYTGTVPAP